MGIGLQAFITVRTHGNEETNDLEFGTADELYNLFYDTDSAFIKISDFMPHEEIEKNWFYYHEWSEAVDGENYFYKENIIEATESLKFWTKIRNGAIKELRKLQLIGNDAEIFERCFSLGYELSELISRVSKAKEEGKMVEILIDRQ